MNVPEVRPPVVFSLDQTRAVSVGNLFYGYVLWLFSLLYGLNSTSVPFQVFSNMSLEDLKASITEQEKLSMGVERAGSPEVPEFRGFLNESLRGKQRQEQGKTTVRITINYD